MSNRIISRRYSKKQIIEETGLAKATFYKYWERLVELKIVKVTRTFGKTKLYKLDEQNPVVKRLKDLELALIEITAPSAVKAMPA